VFLSVQRHRKKLSSRDAVEIGVVDPIRYRRAEIRAGERGVNGVLNAGSAVL
jgi:hypothetical protein